MIELLPSDNVDFVINEARRINNFGEGHFDGAGFTDITPVGKKPFKTIEKLIDISEAVKVMVEAGLERIQRIHMQGVGLLVEEKAPLGFGTHNFAVLFETEEKLVRDIWLAGHVRNKEEQEKLTAALLLFGKEYNFILVNWDKCEYYDLRAQNKIEEFIESISSQFG